MLSDASFRMYSFAILAALIVAACLTAAGPGSEIAFGAGSHHVKPAKTIRNGRALVFEPRHLDADHLGRARLVHSGKRKGLNPRVVRRVLSNKGKLTAKLPTRWIPGRADRKNRSMKHKREQIARATRLVITVRGTNAPTPTPTAPDPPTVSDQLRVGLVTNSQGWDMNSEAVLNATEPTKAKWLREEFDWSVVEPKNNVWRWERYDHLLIEAASRNIRILPLLMDTPSWAGSSWNEMPTDPTEFAQYTAKLTGRYGPGGIFWQAHPEIASFAPQYFEIWNEPFLSYFSSNGVSPARYARLVKAASVAGSAANPQAKFLLAGEQTPTGAELDTWIDDMYAAVPNLNSYFDAVAVHPYGGSSAPDDPRGGWGFPRIADIRKTFVDHGAADKPLWITEVGWSTCPDLPDYCTSEKNQAAYLSKMFTLLSTKYSSYVDAAFVYHRSDFNNSSPSDKEGWFGLERTDGSHKPAFGVFREAAAAGAS